MHSKWQIWDFFSSVSREHLQSFEGLLALNTFDSLCLKFVKDFLIRGAGERVIHYKMANEVTADWIEEEFQNLSLFGNSECFFIHEAQNLKIELLEQLTNADVTGRFVILSFENEMVTWKKLVKDNKIPQLVVESPRFWELNKLLDFVCQYLRLPLSYESKSWILDALENNLPTFYNACCLIKLNHPETKEISLAEVKELLTLEKLDQFQMASLIARKKEREFFDKLVQIEGDFEKMRGFFMFMQSHLVKMADTSYLSKKPRLTQYDKDIQGTSKLWQMSELMRLMETFNQWEILCKKKDSHLWHEIKQCHLQSLSR